VQSYINRLSIVKKLRLLFAIIIVSFVVIMTYSTFFTASMRDQQEYLVTHVIGRNLLLTNMQEDFRSLSTVLVNAFNNAEWLAAADEQSINALHIYIDERAGGLLQLGNDYINAINEDALMSETLRAEALSRMAAVLASIHGILEYYRFDYAALQYAEFEAVLANHANPTINLIEGIREMNLAVIVAISENLHRRQAQYLWANLAAFGFVIILTFAVFWLIIDNLKKRMEQFETRAQRIKSGNFDLDMQDSGTDELSRLSNMMGDVVNVFSGMIGQVIKVAGDIGAGKFNARLQESQFEGDFHKAATSINMLAEKVVDAAAVKAEKEYFSYVQFMMDTVPLVITYWDEKFKIVGCNDEAARRYGLHSKQEYIEGFMKFSPPMQPDGTLSEVKAKHLLQKALKDGYAKFNWLHQDKHGNIIPSEIQIHRWESMGKPALFSYATDMRDFHKAIEETKRSANAEESSKAKSRFLARMSHEIRTPISAVLGISEIQLQNPSLPMSVEESFAKIYSSSQILLGIINDILDLSKIESEKMEILHEDYDMASLINDIVQLNVFRIGSKKIKFELDIDPGIPSIMKGDELRIKQVMNNLLSNSFKYTDSGKVSLSISFRQNGDAPKLYFKVADTGCGMSQEDLKMLFKEFSRFNENKHRSIEGIGLGMAIVDNLVRLMGAKMDIESSVGVGTTTMLEIPQSRASDDVLGDDMIDNLKNFKMANRFASKSMMFKPDPMPYGSVLVVDDVDTNLFVAKGLMSFYSLKVETCDSGYAALGLIKGGNVYDIVFMDQMMPGMDGIETTKLIREWGYKNPIVALTANALIGQSEVFIENGFDGFISKPIDTSHLNSILNKFIRDKQPHEVVEAARRNAAQKEQAEDGMRDLEKSIRREFAKSQKNAAKEIRAAFEAGDVASCRRFAHTLKGLARTIKEDDLASTASKLETIFEKGEAAEPAGAKVAGAEGVADLLDALDTQLAAVLENIPAEQNPLSIAGEGAEAIDLEKVLADLEPLLQEDSVDSLEAAKQLKALPQAAIVLRQIELFDFEGALKNLALLRDVAS